MTVRAKFRVTGKVRTPDGYEVMMRPVVSGSPENEAFYKCTPWGEIRLGTVSPKVADDLEVQTEYYVDFVPAATPGEVLEQAAKARIPVVGARAVHFSSDVEITADAPSFGGASHSYFISITDEDGGAYGTLISFQKGPIKEHGVNGVTSEALLEVVADRLRCFQAGPFPCDENAEALTCVEVALKALYERTAKRRARGVEGTNVK